METVNLRGKTVLLSAPWQAPSAPLVGREAEINLILACWIDGSSTLPFTPLLIGPPGVGKNRIVYECAKICGKELYIFQGHEDVTAEDFACTVRFSDDPDRKVDYVLSSLTTAMIRGGLCLIDEIGKMRQRALAALVSVLDERRYLDSIVLGERIEAHPGFQVIAATNDADMEVRADAAEFGLPDFIRSRLRPPVPVGCPARDEIEAIIHSRLEFLNGHSAALLDRFWILWRGAKADRMPTPRDVIYVFGLARKLVEFEGAPAMNPDHVERSFEHLMGRSRGR